MFIHTFSLKKYITEDEFLQIINLYKQPENKYGIISPRDGRHDKEIIEYCKNGIRIALRFRSETERKYDYAHMPVELLIIVTPYKLWNPGAYIGQLDDKEFEFVPTRTKEMLDKISQKINTDLTGLIIDRIDITHDVVTPDRDYADAILEAQRYFPLPRGYKQYLPTDTQLQKGWNENFSYQFYHSGKGLLYKVYDKISELEEQDIQYEPAGKTGLIRYEISMKRKYLKKRFPELADNASALLLEVNRLKSFLMHDLYEMPFTDLGMVSKDVMKKLLKEKLAGKEKTISDMLKLSKQTSLCIEAGMPPDPEHICISRKKYKRLIRKFSELGILPVSLDPDFPYIPSIHEQMDATYNRKLLKFAIGKTRKKVYWNEQE